jgi:ribosomal protein S18 acetylase RimI-like enzyme
MKRIFHKIVIVLGLIGTVGAATWFYAWQQPTLIYDVNLEQDTQPILAIFATDSYWLDAGYDETQDKYRRMLKYGYVNDNPTYPNRLKFKVLRDKGLLIGFTAYYKTAPTVGKILFVAVRSDMRGKRYGEVLMNTAMQELRHLGAKRIELTTRVSNTAAQKLYTRIGFKETARDDEYVHFAYTPA